MKKNDRIELRTSVIQAKIIEEIEKLMEENNYNHSQLANDMGKSKSFISQLFHGNKSLNLEHLAKIEDIFKTQVNIEFNTVQLTENLTANTWYGKFSDFGSLGEIYSQQYHQKDVDFDKKKSEYEDKLKVA